MSALRRPTAFLPLVLGAVSFLLLATPGHAARWRSIGPYGGQIENLVIDPVTPSILYTGTHSGGVFKTLDGGATWSAAKKGLPGDWVTALAIDPVTPTTLYAGIGNAGVAKSTNGGATWQTINTGLTNFGPQALAIDPSNPAIVYLGTFQGAGIFKSTNGGTNWSPVSGMTNQNVQALAIVPTDPSVLYAATAGGGVFKSTNAGAGWSPSNTGLPSLSTQSVVVDPATAGTVYALCGFDGLFKSVNDGATWAPTNNGFTHLHVSDLAIDSGNSANLFAATFHGLFRSQNGGGLWTPATGGLPGSGFFPALVLDPSTPSTLYVGVHPQGVFKSTSSGAAWAPASNGLAALDVQEIVIGPPGEPTLFVGAGGGVYRSVDAGASWGGAELTSGQVVSLAVDPQGIPATLYAGTNTNGQFRKSTDGGATWNSANDGFVGATAHDIEMDQDSPATLYAGGFGTTHTVFRSDNGAASWTPSAAGLPSDFFPVLALDPDDSNHLFVGSSINGVFATSNGGSSWTPSGNGITTPFIAALAAANATTYYAGTFFDGVFKTTNAGANWSPVNTGLPGSTVAKALAVDAGNSAILYTGGFEGVFKTSNAGGNWIALNAGLTDLEINTLAVDPASPNILYAGTAGSSVFRLVQPPDPPPGAFLTSPKVPGFRFKVRITGGSQTLSGKAESDCIGETLCISGAKAGRSELFVRVIGPRPNGFLWLNLVRFTPSRVEVWAEQLSSGELSYYDLPALPPDGTALIGLVDKEAFEPAESAALEREIDAAGPEVTFVPPAFPGYRFTVRIFSGASEQPAKLESDCIPETACVSGAKPGRSEMFLRIIGPRPNGFLWVNLVRFTTSRVEVTIERLSTGSTQTYELAQVAPDSAELPGIVDKEAFVP